MHWAECSAGWNFPHPPLSTLHYHGMLSRNHDERGTCRRRMRAWHNFLLVLRVYMSEEVSTDKATWQASMATTIRIHQCCGFCLGFVHIVDHRIAGAMYWLSVLYGLFHCVASRGGVSLDVFSLCGISRHPPSALPCVVPCGGTFVPCARSCVSCGGVPGIQLDKAARLSAVRRLASSATAVSAPNSRPISILHQSPMSSWFSSICPCRSWKAHLAPRRSSSVQFASNVTSPSVDRPA